MVERTPGKKITLPFYALWNSAISKGLELPLHEFLSLIGVDEQAFKNFERTISQEEVIEKHKQADSFFWIFIADENRFHQNGTNDNLAIDLLKGRTDQILGQALCQWNKKELIPLLQGFLIQASQNYALAEGVMLAMELIALGERQFPNAFLEILHLQEGETGSIGLINPLRPSPFDGRKEKEEWLYTNTLATYILERMIEKE